MRPSQRSRSRSRASQRSAEAGDTQPQASKAPSGDGELQAGPPPSSRAAKPTGSRPRWRQGTLPEAPGAAPEDGPHKHEDTQEPEDNQRESRQQAYRGPWRRPGPTNEEWIEARGQTYKEILQCFEYDGPNGRARGQVGGAAASWRDMPRITAQSHPHLMQRHPWCSRGRECEGYRGSDDQLVREIWRAGPDDDDVYFGNYWCTGCWMLRLREEPAIQGILDLMNFGFDVNNPEAAATMEAP